MMLNALPSIIFAATLLSPPTNSLPITSAAEVRQLLQSGQGAGRTFEFTGTIVHEQSPLVGTFHLLSKGQMIQLHRFPQSLASPIVPGDIVRVRGEIVQPSGLTPQAHVLQLTRRGHEAPPVPRDVTAKDVFSGHCTRDYVRIEGKVLDAHHDDIDPHFTFFILNCDGKILCATLPERPSLDELHDLIGAHVAVIGICDRAPNVRRHQNYEINMQSRRDLHVIAYPPWWTPPRLLAMICLLAAVLVGIVVWNVMLNRRSERRGKELADERLAHVSSELRIMERTRLAVELHDTLAQNLTGISLEVQAARASLTDHPELTDSNLAHVAKSLEACRRELRNSLRDLRSDALEQADMNEAIRMTLKSHVENARIAVRFNVPRERLSDNAAHTILRIIRELVLNALRHGHATAIRVAGSIENDRLLFSVQDDGCGFDPDNRPGPRDGHFGLLGIQERVKTFNGTLTIDSKPNYGSKITIGINLPHPKEST